MRVMRRLPRRTWVATFDAWDHRALISTAPQFSLMLAGVQIWCGMGVTLHSLRSLNSSKASMLVEVNTSTETWGLAHAEIAWAVVPTMTLASTETVLEGETTLLLLLNARRLVMRNRDALAT